MVASDQIRDIRAREPTRAGSVPAPATVLIVDDRSINREFLGYVLASCGHALEFAGDGHEALASARRRPPDLIITDVAMPGMDGLELAVALREDGATAEIPVIFYTATYRLEQTRELAQACGVALVLPKPSEPEIIIAEVAKILSSRPAASVQKRALASGAEPAAGSGLQEQLQRTFAVGPGAAAERMADAPTTSDMYRLSLRLAAVLELSLNLSAERKPRHLLELLCRAARDIVAVRATGVALLGTEGAAVWYAGDDDGDTEPRPIDAKMPFIADAVRSRVPLHLAAGDARLAEVPAAIVPATELLAVPVLSPSGALGALYFADKAGDGSFDPHDELFATTLAALLATYYDNLRLLTEVQRNAVELAANANRYRLLFESNPVPMWVYDLETLAFLAVNDAAVEQYGYSREQFLAMTIEDIRPAADLAALHDSLAENSGGLDHSGIWIHRRRDGALISVSITSHTIDFSRRRAKLVLALDVSERIEQERRIARLSRIRAVTGAINSAMLRLNDRIALLEEACRIATTEGVFPVAFACQFDADSKDLRIVAFRGDASVRAATELAAADAASRQGLPHFRAAASGKPMIIDDLAAAAPADAARPASWPVSYRSCAAFPLFAASHVVAVLVFLAEDRGYFDADEFALLNRLTADLSFALEHIEQSERLAHLAYYDALTGLPSMRLFADRLEQILHVARQDRGKVCVLALDLERFTRINDLLGRDVGDELLRQVSVRLGEYMVEPYTLGRVGADTFAVASSRDGDAIATRLGERIAHALQRPFVVAGHEVAITAQSGIALFPADGDDPYSLFKNAEAALRQAKAEGRRSAYYSSEISDRIERRLELAEQLRVAIEAEQFVLHYQPRVDMASGAVVGAEALIRWQHPTRGLVPPVEFIGLAEDTGLIVPIGSWAIERVCAQVAAWGRAGIEVVPVAVNLSSAQFETGDLFEVVRAALKRHSLAPALLELELTESAVMKDSDAAASTLRTLRGLGVGLALDDFGTGHSSLAHLKRFPFDAVKIDRTFITDITQNTEDAAIAAAIIAMAHRMELRVVAEGVETQGQFNYLRLQDCDEMQGFLFSPAVAADAFAAALAGGWRFTLPAADPADQRTLLVVDDEEGIRNALRRTLRRDGYRILTAASADEALELLALHRVQVIISDQRMPGISGTEFLGVASQLYPDTVRIILSGYTDLAVVTESVNRGAVFKFLTKPWDDGLLREQVRDAFRRYRPDPSR